MQSGLGLASQAGCSDAYSFSLENLISQFGALAGAPDELVPGLDYGKMPCPKGKKASKKCQEKNEREKSEDNNKATQTGNQPPSKTEEDSQPTQTGNERPSTTGDQQQPTQTSKETSSTSDYVGPTAKPDCAAIGRNDFEALMELEIYEEEESLAEKRSLRSTLQSRRLEARRLKPKEGYACIVKDPGGRIRQTKLDSKKYPQSGDKPMVGPKHAPQNYGCHTHCSILDLQITGRSACLRVQRGERLR